MFAFGRISTPCDACYNHEIVGIVKTEQMYNVGTICPKCLTVHSRNHHVLLPENAVAFVAEELKNPDRKSRQELDEILSDPGIALDTVLLALLAAAHDEKINFNDLLLQAIYVAHHKTD